MLPAVAVFAAGAALGAGVVKGIQYICSSKEERAAKKEKEAASSVEMAEENLNIRRKQLETAKNATAQAATEAKEIAARPKRAKAKA